jgi:membrane-bound ClpP family serine protease
MTARAHAEARAHERQAMMTSFQPSEPIERYAPAPTRPKNGLGIAALVLGVASLVAAVSFVLFPLALLGGLIAVILGLIALTHSRNKGATNSGQAAAGVICGVLALAVAIVFSVRVGTFVAHNTTVFTNFDNCIAKAGNRSEVANCIATLADKIR